MGTIIDPVRAALDPAHYPGRGGFLVRVFVALVFVQIALGVVVGVVLLALFATGTL